MNKQKYDAIIFDLFGTLVDNFPREAFARFLSELAEVLDVPSQAFIELWNGELWPRRVRGEFATLEETFASICRHFGVSVDDGRIAHAVQMRYEYTRLSLVPRHDAVETLTTLKDAGYKLGLISDCTLEVPQFWPETPLAALIDVPIFSCTVRLKKPDPRIYTLACEGLAVQPQRCLYVGDGGSQELTGAAAAGMATVLIRAPDEEIHPYREDQGWTIARISSVKALLPFVLS